MTSTEGLCPLTGSPSRIVTLDLRASPRQFQMLAAGGDQHAIRLEPVARGRPRGPTARETAFKPRGQRPGKLRRHVLHDHDRRHGRPDRSEQLVQRRRAARRDAQRHALVGPLGRAGLRVRFGRRGRSRSAPARSLLPPGHHAANVHAGRGANLFDQLAGKRRPGIGTAAGLGHVVDRAAVQRSSVIAAPACVSALTMITGVGLRVKDRVQHGEAIHVGHLDVERDHVGAQGGDARRAPRGRCGRCRPPHSPAPPRPGRRSTPGSRPSRPPPARGCFPASYVCHRFLQTLTLGRQLTCHPNSAAPTCPVTRRRRRPSWRRSLPRRRSCRCPGGSAVAYRASPGR